MVVGITGGIGSGKSTVVKEFIKLGIPCYIADVEAKKLMLNSKNLQTKIVALLGKKAYQNNTLNKSYIASLIFNNKELLQQLNAIVHPAVHQHFKEFANKNKTPYCVYESAILFENKNEHLCDKIIVVTASLEERIARVMKRDGVERNLVLERINSQWSQEEKVKRADYTILNNNKSFLEQQVQQLHKEFLSL